MTPPADVPVRAAAPRGPPLAVPLDPQKKLARLAHPALGTARSLMKIAITGASGNVGTALLRRLAADGADELVGISRRPPPRIAPYASASWHAVDLSRQDSRTDLVSALDGVEAVVHAAWAIQPSHDRELLRATNQGGTMAVVSAARAAGVRHLVHLSSIGAYAAAPGQWKDEGWSTSGCLPPRTASTRLLANRCWTRSTICSSLGYGRR